MPRSRLRREGFVGLFILSGIVLFGGIIFFLRGSNLQNKDYQVKLAFANAGGLREGARVFYRGVAVGKITGITPSSNGVEVMTEIDGNLRIPKNVKVSTLRSGLLGEVSVNIIPENDLSDIAKQIDPNSEACTQQTEILCNNNKVSGKATPDVVESLSGIAERFNNDEFYEMLISTVDSVNETTEQMTELTQKVTVAVDKLTKDFDTIVATSQDIGTTAQQIGETAQRFGDTADSLSRTAETANEQLALLGSEYSNTAVELSLLANNLNQVIDENRVGFSDAIANFTQTADEVSQLVQNTDQLLAQVSPDDVAKISKNLTETSDNLTKITEDLQGISDELNNPANLVTLQQTLDSARVTFANTAKITSDIDEFTGDPEFRNNIRKLIDGLGQLVSYTDNLEKQIELANLLDKVEKITAVENQTIQQLSTINSLSETTKTAQQEISLPNE